MAGLVRIIEAVAALGGAVFLLAQLWGMVRRWRWMRYLPLVLLCGLATDAEAAAPARSEAWCTSVGLTCTGGLPYAEPTLCALSTTIMCEDFNGGSTFFPVTLNGETPPCLNDCTQAWYNPAQTGIGGGTWSSYGVGNRYINAVSTYPALTSTSLPSNGQDYVHTINHDSTLGRTNGYGALWVFLRDVASHNPGDGGSGVIATMQSGHTDVKEFHVRFQIYWTYTGNGDHEDFVPNGFPKSDTYANSTSGCYGHKIVFHYTPGGSFEPAGSSTDGGLGADCGLYDNNTTGAHASGARYGNALQLYPCGGPCGYEQWPLGFFNDDNATYMSYGGYQSTSLSTRPNDSLLSQRIWRFNIGQKYTFEYHLKWSTPQATGNGIAEVWVDGTKIYSNSNLKNCFNTGIDAGNSQRVNDNCTTYGLGSLFLSDYQGALDETVRAGQQVIDNLVVSSGDTYIGVPGGASSSGTVALFLRSAGAGIALLHVLFFAGHFWQHRTQAVQTALRFWQYALETPREMFWVYRYKRACKRWQNAAPLMLPPPVITVPTHAPVNEHAD